MAEIILQVIILNNGNYFSVITFYKINIIIIDYPVSI